MNPAPLVTFPAPASSNAACGFPALRFPACFASRVMWPFASGALSEQPIAAASYSTSSNRAPSVSAGSAFSFTYILCLRSRSSSAPLSSRLCLPCCQSHYRQRGRFPPPALPGFPGTTNPSATLSPVSRLPGAPGYTAYLCSADFSPGRGGLLQLLSASSSPCRRYHPARVSQRFSQSALRHAAFVLRKRTRPPDLMCSRGYLCVHSRYGPVTRRPPFTVAVSMGFRSSVSLLPAIQATGLWLLPRRVCSPAERASLCWTHFRTHQCSYIDLFIDRGTVHLFIPIAGSK